MSKLFIGIFCILSYIVIGFLVSMIHVRIFAKDNKNSDELYSPYTIAYIFGTLFWPILVGYWVSTLMKKHDNTK